MRKKFRTKYKFKSRNNYNYGKIVISILAVIVLLFISIKLIFFLNSKFNNKYFVNNLLSYSNNFIKKDNKKRLSLLSITKPYSLIGINYKGLVKHNLDNMTVVKEEKNENKKNKDAPTVLIYSTHSSETYKNTNSNPYNITPTVRFPSYILKEKLGKLGINSIVDETDVIGVLNSNGWNYGASYSVSRMIIEDAKKKYPSIKYFIDIHRDSALINTTKMTSNNKDYARLLFIVGMENKEYEFNLSITNDLNNKLNSTINNISRGIYKKSGPGVDGVYNQDLSSNAILLEVGGVDNTIDEVHNSMELFANIYGNYILERINNV